MTGGDRLSVLDHVLDAAVASGSSRSGLLGSIVDAVAGAASPDLAALSRDLFAVVDAMEANPSLRRAMTDPSTPEDGRRQLAHALFDGRIGAPAPISSLRRRPCAGPGAGRSPRRWIGRRSEPSSSRPIRTGLSRRPRTSSSGSPGRSSPTPACATHWPIDPWIEPAARNWCASSWTAGPRTRPSTGPTSGRGAGADLRPHHRGLRHPGRSAEEPGGGHRSGGAAAHSGAVGATQGGADPPGRPRGRHPGDRRRESPRRGPGRAR